VEGAVSQHKRALALDPLLAQAHYNLGNALRNKGQFEASLAAFRRFQALAALIPEWRALAATRVRETKRLVDLDAKLPAVLRGAEEPADAELLGFAQCCQYKGLCGQSVRFYRRAFAANPKLAEDPRTGRREDAACVAALAGCGRGDDAGEFDSNEQPGWRQQSLDWLRVDLAFWTKQLNGVNPKDRAQARQTLQHWRRAVDFAGVRDAPGLAGLPQAERQAWEKFWAEVDLALRGFAAAGAKPPR
jgi:tetratricopeptide (TPR) repeat protein